MPPFVQKTWLNGRDNGVNARWNAAAANDLETRIATAIGSGGGGGGGGAPSVVNQGTITTDATLDMSTYQDVIWVVTLGATNLKLEISGWSVTKSVTLQIHQDASGGRVLAQLPTALWEGGAIPVGSIGGNDIDIRAFYRSISHTFGFESGTGMA